MVQLWLEAQVSKVANVRGGELQRFPKFCERIPGRNPGCEVRSLPSCITYVDLVLVLCLDARQDQFDLGEHLPSKYVMVVVGVHCLKDLNILQQRRSSKQV